MDCAGWDWHERLSPEAKIEAQVCVDFVVFWGRKAMWCTEPIVRVGAQDASDTGVYRGRGLDWHDGG